MSVPASSSSGASFFLDLSQFDLSKFVGKWYQLMLIPNWFQPALARNTTATYQVLQSQDPQDKNENVIIVHNEQIAPSGKLESITGAAVVVAPAQFSVQFFGAIAKQAQVQYEQQQQQQASASSSSSSNANASAANVNASALINPKRFRDYFWSRNGWDALTHRFLHPQQVNYVIYVMDQAYTWAIVGSPDKKKGWVLSRTPAVSCHVWSMIRQQLQQHEFNLSAFVYTPQPCLSE